MKKRWKVVCSYDGTNYCGWQVQPNGISIQEVIEKRLADILKDTTRIHGSGRTDSGVHARGQVFHFDAEWSHGKEKLLNAMRGTMPESIFLQQITGVSTGFHSRFSATGKHYRYRIYLGIAPPHLTRYYWSFRYHDFLEWGRLQKALQMLEGWHDFRSFSVNRGEPYETTWRCISSASYTRNGPILNLDFRGNGFLYKMVRGLVGAVMGMATGRITAGEFQELLQGRERKGLISTAPSQGLSLEKVYYKNRVYPSPPSDVCLPDKFAVR